MSTTNKGLSKDQQTALNNAIDLYVIANMRMHGGIKAKPVILIPGFEEDTNGTWVPVNSNGVRVTKKENLSFLRFGMPTISISGNGTPEVKVVKTNVFNDTSKLELLVATYDLRIGDALPDTVLVVEESLIPFSNTNPERDAKVSGASGIPCTFMGEYNGVTYDTPAPIYRRVKLAPAGTANTLIQHTNKEEIKKHTALANVSKPSAGIADAAKKASRIQELKAIPKAKRTEEQVAELADLQD